MTDDVDVDDYIMSVGRDLSEVVAPGVLAWIKQDGVLFEVMYVEAVTEGTGDVGRWFDALPADLRVVVPNVMNPRLAGLLERRGYRECKVARPLHLLGMTWIDAWVHPPTNGERCPNKMTTQAG